MLRTSQKTAPFQERAAPLPATAVAEPFPRDPPVSQGFIWCKGIGAQYGAQVYGAQYGAQVYRCIGAQVYRCTGIGAQV